MIDCTLGVSLPYQDSNLNVAIWVTEDVAGLEDPVTRV